MAARMIRDVVIRNVVIRNAVASLAVTGAVSSRVSSTRSAGCVISVFVHRNNARGPARHLTHAREKYAKGGMLPHFTRGSARSALPRHQRQNRCPSRYHNRQLRPKQLGFLQSPAASPRKQPVTAGGCDIWCMLPRYAFEGQARRARCRVSRSTISPASCPGRPRAPPFRLAGP